MRGDVLLTGGFGRDNGIRMRRCQGEYHGISVGIIPLDETRYANQQCDVVIATAIRWARDFTTE